MSSMAPRELLCLAECYTVIHNGLEQATYTSGSLDNGILGYTEYVRIKRRWEHAPRLERSCLDAGNGLT